MESIERYCSLQSKNSKNFIRGTFYELSRTYDKVLHPDEVVEPVLDSYDDKISIVDYLGGFDLLNNTEVPDSLPSSFFLGIFQSRLLVYSHILILMASPQGMLLKKLFVTLYMR